MTSKDRVDVYEEVTNRIVAALENSGEWQKPWTSIFSGVPINARTARPYRGVNSVLLGVIAANQGWNSNEWATYKAWAERGGQVRKGEKGSPCVFWKEFRKVNDEGKEEKFLMARLYSVFNGDQVDGGKRRVQVKPKGLHTVVAEAESYLKREGIKMVTDGSAWYSPSRDTIGMPSSESFVSPDHYACTLLHECAHSTGHKSRLDRNVANAFGSHNYAAEEVVAELAAAMAMAATGREYLVQHNAAYLANWIGAMKEDKRAVFKASSAAQKAADYIVGKAEVEDEESEEKEAA